MKRRLPLCGLASAERRLTLCGLASTEACDEKTLTSVRTGISRKTFTSVRTGISREILMGGWRSRCLTTAVYNQHISSTSIPPHKNVREKYEIDGTGARDYVLLIAKSNLWSSATSTSMEAHDVQAMSAGAAARGSDQAALKIYDP